MNHLHSGLALSEQTPARQLWMVVRFWLIVPFASILWTAPPVASATGLSGPTADTATWDNLDDEAVVTHLRTSLDRLGLDGDQMDRLSDQIRDLLATGAADPLDAFVATMGRELPVVDELTTVTQRSPLQAAASLDPDSAVYQAIEAMPESIRMTVRTWVGRELVRRRLYDEALPVIAEVDPVQTVDPAAVLFYRAVCYHALLMKKETLADLRRLLERKDDIPRRYSRTAALMVADIKSLEDDSLDEVSRLMTDVSRRLDLGRSDDQVDQQEQLIIDKLTKLIEDLEEQQKQQQQQRQSGQGGGGGQGGGPPMAESDIADTKGDGDVDRKKLGQADGWGNLPPAQRKEVLQQLSQDLPTHYREAIEAYFRKLARTK